MPIFTQRYLGVPLNVLLSYSFCSRTEFYNNVVAMAEMLGEGVEMQVSLPSVFFESQNVLQAPTIYATHTAHFRDTFPNRNASVIASRIHTGES